MKPGDLVYVLVGANYMATNWCFTPFYARRVWRTPGLARDYRTGIIVACSTYKLTVLCTGRIIECLPHRSAH